MLVVRGIFTVQHLQPGLVHLCHLLRRYVGQLLHRRLPLHPLGRVRTRDGHDFLGSRPEKEGLLAVDVLARLLGQARGDLLEDRFGGAAGGVRGQGCEGPKAAVRMSCFEARSITSWMCEST